MRVPRPLAALLLVVALFGTSWALLTPAWQAPDEDVHFSYVQTLVESGRLPGGAGTSLSQAQVDAMQSMNTDPVVFFPFARPEWSATLHRDYLERAPRDRVDDGGGPNNASGYPPAYYLYGTLGYRLGGSGNVLDNLYATRLVSMLLLLVTTTAVWLLIGELFGRRRELQLVGAAAVGLWPMLHFMSASVNPDSLMYASWALALWLGVRIIRRGPGVGSAIGIGLAVAVALLSKAASVALLPAVAALLLFSVGRLLLDRQVLRAVLLGVAALAAFLIPVQAWDLYVGAQDRPAFGQTVGVSSVGLNVREFLSYVWQFYLPRLPSQQPLRLDIEVVSSYPAYNVWIAMAWGAFGWVTVYFPKWLYDVFLAITLVVLAAAGWRGLRLVGAHRRDPRLLREWLPIVVFLLLALGALVGGLHLAEYRIRGAVVQGRYLFPMAGLAASLLVLAVTLVPAGVRRFAIATVLGGLLAFQLFALGFVAVHYYA